MIRRGLLSVDLDYVLNESQSSLKRMRDKRILITGASGFLGFWLGACLLEANFRFGLNTKITITSSKNRETKNFDFNLPVDSVDLIYGNLFEGNSSPLKNQEKFDFIFHNAISNNLNGDSNTFSFELDFLQAILENNCDRRTKFILPSSGAVYGAQPPSLARIPENLEFSETVGELTQYANFKKKSEEILIAATTKELVQGYSPRMFTFFGPRLPLDGQFAIGNFMKDGKSGTNIKINGNSQSKRSYLYMADAIIWLLRMTENLPISNLHIGSDDITSIEGLAKVVSQKFEVGYELSRSSRNVALSNYVPETFRSQKSLNISEKISLQEGLNRWDQWLDLT